MRRILLVFGAVVALALAGAGAGLWWFLSQFDARAVIVQRVKAATGRDFAIRGPVSISFWPAIGFKGEDAVLANVAGGAAPQLLQAKEIVLGVALKPLLQRRVEVTGFVLTAPVLSLEVDAEGRPNWILKPAAPAPAPRPGTPKVDTHVESVDLQGLTVADGRISYTNARTHTAYALDDVDMKASLKGLDGALDIDGAATFRDQRMDIDLTLGRFRAVIAGQTTPVTLSIDTPRVKSLFIGDLDVKTGGLAGDVTASGPSLRGLMDWVGAPLGAGPGFEAFSISGRMTVGPRRFAFENAAVGIDKVEARGDFLLEQGAGKPLLSGRLEFGALDLNPYLQPRTTAGVQVATLQPVDVATPGWSELPVDLSGLKGMNANLDISTGPLQILKVKVDKSRLAFVLNDGYLAATISELAMYRGNGTSRLEIDARTPEVVIRDELAVQAIDTKAFFADAFGLTNLEGTAKLDWGFTSKGRNQKEMIQSMSGAGTVSFRDGVLHGVDLGGVSRTIRNVMRHELVTPTAQTRFSSLGGTFRAADGVIATQDLRLDTADAKITAVGVIDAGQRAIDARLVSRFSGAILPVAFRASGPWTGIVYASDILGRAKPAIEAKARAVIAKAPRR